MLISFSRVNNVVYKSQNNMNRKTTPLHKLDILLYRQR